MSSTSQNCPMPLVSSRLIQAPTDQTRNQASADLLARHLRSSPIALAAISRTSSPQRNLPSRRFLLPAAMPGKRSRSASFRACVLAPSPQPPNRIPLGLLMVARGKLTYLEVSAALEAQRRARYGKIGEWIEKLGFATEQEVTTALALQWGCPVASSFDPSALQCSAAFRCPSSKPFRCCPSTMSLRPTRSISLSENASTTPLSMPSKRFSIAAPSPALLDAKGSPASSMPCAKCRVLHDVEFGPMNDLAEMARIASSYTARLTPEQVRLSRIGRFIWLRLDVNRYLRSKTRSLATNLIFRLATPSPQTISFIHPSESRALHESDKQ